MRRLPIDPEFTLPGNAVTRPEVAGRGEAGARCPHCATGVALGAVIRVCPRCKTVHHNACWRVNDRCASYECAPTTRAEPANPWSRPTSVMVISAGDLSRAQPLPTVSRPIAAPAYVYRKRPAGPKLNRMAVASFLTALAGIPFFGLLTGLVAVLLAATALYGIRERRERGTLLASLGFALGVADVVGWVFFLYWALPGGFRWPPARGNNPPRPAGRAKASVDREWPRGVVAIGTSGVGRYSS